VAENEKTSARVAQIASKALQNPKSGSHGTTLPLILPAREDSVSNKRE
jgi:hypothetical protein